MIRFRQLCSHPLSGAILLYPVRSLCCAVLCQMEPASPTKPDVPLRSFQIVVAATRELGIGHLGRLPWRLPSDLKLFKDVTSSTTSSCAKNAVIMGRHTWNSLPPSVRPLPGRINIILSRSLNKDENLGQAAIVSESLLDALAMLAAPPLASLVESVFVIGGGQVFREAMNSSFCGAIHLTEIETSFNCDTFFPPIDAQCFRLWYASCPTVENGIRYSFTSYLRQERKNSSSSDIKSPTLECALPRRILAKHEEYQYLKLVKDIIDTGVTKSDRTGVGTISKFGYQMRFNLRKSFPLLTTKQVFWRGVVEELLWFISGSTDARILQQKGIHIWDSNGSREYLDSIGLHNREEGDLGPVYGFQWRHFGAKYSDMYEDYNGKGFDQLADVVHKIRTNPSDRRIILSAWNPADLQQMALPPCHMFAQFYVANGELSCQMYQRSCDMGLGVPFNIASYALLTCLLAHVCGLSPGDYVHVLGDAHVYSNHVRPLQAQLQNTPKPFPLLRIVGNKKSIDTFEVGDIELIDYLSCGSIFMKMAV